MDDALTVQMQVPPCRVAPMPAVWRLRQLYGAYARCMALMPAVWRLCQLYFSIESSTTNSSHDGADVSRRRSRRSRRRSLSMSL